MRKFKIVLFFCFTYSFVAAQITKLVNAEYRKIAEVYSGDSGISYTASFSYYESGSSLPNSKYSYNMATNMKSVHFKLNNMDRFFNSRVSIIVDHVDKRVILDKPDESALKAEHIYSEMNKYAFSKTTKIDTITLGADLKGFVFNFGNDLPYTQIQITYSPQTYYLHSVEIKYHDGSRVHAVYTNHSLRISNEYISSEIAIISPIPARKKKLKRYKPVLAEAYKSYRLINHLN